MNTKNIKDVNDEFLDKKFKEYNFDLFEILKSEKSNINNKDFKEKYRNLRDQQIKTILNIIYAIENNFHELKDIISLGNEIEHLSWISYKVKWYNYLSNNQKEIIKKRIMKLCSNRIKLQKINNNKWNWFLFNVMWKIDINIENPEFWPYYLTWKVSREVFDKFQQIIYWYIDKNVQWSCISGYDFPIIIYPDDVLYYKNMLKHEIRHAKDYYISNNKNKLDRMISNETTAYAYESWSFTKWWVTLWWTDHYIEEYNVIDKEKIKFIINKIYNKLYNLDSVNIDLLSMTNLDNRWIFIHKKNDMLKFTKFKSNSIIQKDKKIKTAKWVCKKMWVDPKSFYWEIILWGTDSKGIREDIWIFENCKSLLIKSENISEDISPKISKMKSLKKITLHKNSYDLISKKFLANTKLEFVII